MRETVRALYGRCLMLMLYATITIYARDHDVPRYYVADDAAAFR